MFCLFLTFNFPMESTTLGFCCRNPAGADFGTWNLMASQDALDSKMGKMGGKSSTVSWKMGISLGNFACKYTVYIYIHEWPSFKRAWKTKQHFFRAWFSRQVLEHHPKGISILIKMVVDTTSSERSHCFMKPIWWVFADWEYINEVMDSTRWRSEIHPVVVFASDTSWGLVF